MYKRQLINDTWSFEGKTNNDIVLAYTAFKGWRTRNITKFEHLSALEKGSHSPILAAAMITALDNIEKYSDKVFKIAQYLEDHDHEKAKYYVTESERWVEQCATYAEHLQKLQHKLLLLQGGPIPPPSNPP